MIEKPDVDTSNDEGALQNVTVIFYMKTDNGEIEIGRTFCHADVAEMQGNPNSTRREIVYHSDESPEAA